MSKYHLVRNYVSEEESNNYLVLVLDGKNHRADSFNGVGRIHTLGVLDADKVHKALFDNLLVISDKEVNSEMSGYNKQSETAYITFADGTGAYFYGRYGWDVDFIDDPFYSDVYANVIVNVIYKPLPGVSEVVTEDDKSEWWDVLSNECDADYACDLIELNDVLEEIDSVEITMK